LPTTQAELPANPLDPVNPQYNAVIGNYIDKISLIIVKTAQFRVKVTLSSSSLIDREEKVVFSCREQSEKIKKDMENGS
jgi:hypothetical protein